MIENISSKYILNKIFGYIKDDNNFSLKLFFYSKTFQKKYEININDYITENCIKNGLSIDNYLLYNINEHNEDENYYIKDFDKQMLYKKLKEDSIKYKIDFEILKIILYDLGVKSLKDKNTNEDVYEIKYNEKKEKKLIDIYSPFFEVLSKNEMLEYFYTIRIDIETIQKYNLKNDYISAFKNLNESNIKYGAIKFIYKNKSDLDFLTELNIKFN